MRNKQIVAIAILVLSMLINTSILAESQTLNVASKPDNTSPIITHTPMETITKANKPALISAIVKDFDSGVKVVIVKYRVRGSLDYESIYMKKSARNPNFYYALIPKEYMRSPGVEYYIEAKDYADNLALKGISFSPIHISIAPTTEFGVQTQSVRSSIAQTYTDSTTTESQDNRVMKDLVKKSKAKRNKWIWWTVGIVAGSAVLAAATRDDGERGGDKNPGTGTVVLTAPTP